MSGPLPSQRRPLGLAPDVARDLAGRTAVFHAGRALIGDVLELQDRTLQGRKLVLDALVAAHSVPRQTDVDPGQWVAEQWTASADLLRGQESRDDRSRPDTHEVLDRLRGHLTTLPTGHPVHDLFAAASACCSELYRERWVAPVLDLQHCLTHPGAGPPPDPYSVSARTVRASGEPATVTLELYLPEFGPESYAVLPRLLMHECFCHAVAGHPVWDVDQASVFAEGWMDWAAKFHFTQWLDTYDATFTAAYRHGEALTDHFTRRDAAGRARALGHQYADGLARWFARQRECRPGNDRQVTAQLALEVNLTGFTLSEKDKLTRSLGPSPVPQVQTALLGWLRGSLPAEDVVRAGVQR